MKKILVIEDDKDINDALGLRLRAAGYLVVQAEDGLQGVRMAVNEAPDLLLLDISLPAGDGFSIVERLRLQPALAETPFIMLTASRRPELRARATEWGAVAFLEKPYDSGELLRTIESCLGTPVPERSE